MQKNKITADLFEYELSFNSSDYSHFVNDSLFHLNQDSFDKELPKKVLGSWKMNLIGENIENTEYSLNELKDKKLSIKSLCIDNTIYSTFLNYVQDLSKPESYAQAIFKLSSEKINQTEVDLDDLLINIPIDSKIALSLKKKIKQEAKTLFQNLLNPMDKDTDNDSITARTNLFLISKGIPVDKKESSYYFSVSKHEYEWNVEIYISEKDRFINFYSSLNFDVNQKEMITVLSNINQLNLAINTGNFEYQPELKLLCFKAFSFILNNTNIEFLLDELLSESEMKMLSILPYIERLKESREIKNK